MTKQQQLTDEWLARPLGRRLAALEAEKASSALEEVFGMQLLQIGRWGAPDTFLGAARTQRAALLEAAGPSLAGQTTRQGESGIRLLTEPEDLAVATDCADGVLLPHTLELSPEPHQILREVERILVANGHLIVLGFTPVGPLGLRRLLSRRGYPPGVRQIVRPQRLQDWLSVLGFEIQSLERYFYALPFGSGERLRHSDRMERMGRRFWSRLACAYIIHARKRVFRVIPIGKVMRERRRRVVSLVEPSARIAA